MALRSSRPPERERHKARQWFSSLRHVVETAFSSLCDSFGLQFLRAITCGNLYLASLVPQGNRNVYLYPSPVPTAVPTRNYGEGAGRFRFGWIGGGGNLTSLARIGPALQSLAQNQPLVLRVISDREFTLPGVCVESVPWSLAGQAAALAQLDVGLMPLDGASPFDRGKCSYKVLQYMAAGVVPVGSAVGMNTEVIEDGRNGRLVQSEAEWGRVLAELRNLDGQELSIMGAAARSTALTGSRSGYAR